MHRWPVTVALAITAGCGSVQGMPGDGPPSEILDGTLRQGCVMALHMDEAAWTGAAGEVHDACGNNAGTIRGSANTVAGGAHGRAGSFSGNACIDIVNAPSLHGSTGLTLSAWILPTALNGVDSNGVISKRNDVANQAEYSLYVWTGNRVWVDLDGENDRRDGAAVVSNNAWTQLTVIYDGARPQAQRVRLFVNGSLDATMPETSATLTAYTSPLHVGCMPAPGAGLQQNFLGELDEVVIWNRALTDAEIARWYAVSKP